MIKIILDLIIFLFINNISKLIYGLILQPICFILSNLFPSKIFTIPKKCSPIINKKNDELIPRIIFQTDKTNEVSFAFYLNFLIMRIFNPTFEYRFYDDNDIETFIKSNYNSCYNFYKNINIGAFKADLFRILILHHYGGFYVDTDRSFFMPLLYNKDKSIVLFNNQCFGYHVRDSYKSSKNNYDIFCQDVFGFEKGNQILDEAVKIIESSNVELWMEKNKLATLPMFFDLIFKNYLKLRLEIQVINISFIMHNHCILTNYLHYNFPVKRDSWFDEYKKN